MCLQYMYILRVFYVYTQTASILATGGDDRLLNVWSVGKPNCLHRLSGHQTAVEAIGFDGNETTVWVILNAEVI